ncbi:hypothetical protein PoB_002941000 [Plakobranchus ocellatus]|uniref:Uncharacterized protein n=1 Tax=Plakobranchus ocellatus TaxID=259542 RepID=A0AAV4A457_9GAST|nr:hypothetical protein PoB_002941000 [Plakobranchus ocellatus]
MDGGGRLVEALPGRLTITTHDEPVGDTTYGFLQMHWTTQVPALDVQQSGYHTDRPGLAQHQFRQVADIPGGVTDFNRGGGQDHGFSTHRGAEQQQMIDKTNLPRLPQRAVTMVKKNGTQTEKPGTKRENTLPALTRREKSEFQWSKPMAPAPKRVSLFEAGAPGQEENQPAHSCDQYKWATKKMHHYISSSKSFQLPKMIKGNMGREHTILNTSLDSDVMSVLAHSSVSLMPAMSLEKLMKTIKMAPPPSST